MGAQFLLKRLLLIISLSVIVTSDNNDRQAEVLTKKLDELTLLLFPNSSLTVTTENELLHLRRLQITKKPYTGTVPCTKCDGLSTCSVLNGFQIQEVYYPSNPSYLETCKVIDSLGKRVESLIFGPGRTFRDSTQCRCKGLTT